MKDKNAMVIAYDLVIDGKATTLCGNLGLSDRAVKKQPTVCDECKCVKFRAYIVLGAEEGPMIWECKKCHKRFPKYTLIKMEKLLKKVKHLWTNPDDWGHVEKGDYN